jgi:hypothetical protein
MTTETVNRDSAGVRFFSKEEIIASDEAEDAYEIAEQTVNEIEEQEEEDTE